MKPFLNNTLATLLLLAAAAAPCLAAVTPAGGPVFRVLAQDPPAGATLATGERVFLKIGYRSSSAVRFQAEALRQGLVQEEAAVNAAPPYPAGSGEALVWLSFGGAVRIDAIRVIAYDPEWQQLADLTLPAVVTWAAPAGLPPRQPADWVAPLLKQHRQVFDTALDPLPQKPAPLFDFFLLLSLVAFPCYVAMQLRMLLNYRGTWRWYAAAPLLPFLPLGLYSLIGLGMAANYWIIFLTRYFPAALVYLGLVWLMKRLRQQPATAKHST